MQTLSVWESLKFVVWERVKGSLFVFVAYAQQFLLFSEVFTNYSLYQTIPGLTPLEMNPFENIMDK